MPQSNPMPHTNLRDILIAELADALGSDRLLLTTWPALARAVRTQSHKRLCEEGVDYTQERIERLEKAFAILKVEPSEKRSDGMTCLLEAALTGADRGAAGPLRDAVLLAAIQKLSHYGDAGYGSLVGYAETLGEREIALMLRRSLDEKSAAIEEMTDMAEGEINPHAARDGLANSAKRAGIG